MKTTKHNLTLEEIKDFENFYKEKLVEYCKTYGLFLEETNEKPKNKKFYNYYIVKKNYHFSNLSEYAQNYSLETLKGLVNINFPDTNILWNQGSYSSSFYKYLYSKANNAQQNILQNNIFLCENIFDITHALYESPQELRKYIEASSQLYGNIVKSQDLSTTFSMWKKIFSKDVFYSLVNTFLITNKKHTKTIAATVYVKNAIYQNIDNEKLSTDLINSLYQQDIKDSHPFIEEDFVTFETVVDRNKLVKLISLPQPTHYNTMNEVLVEKLNNIDLYGIVSCEIVTKNGKSNQWKILTKVSGDSPFDKFKFQQFLLGLYRQYQGLSNESNNIFELKKYITTSWIQNCYLDTFIPQKNTTIKKNKI